MKLTEDKSQSGWSDDLYCLMVLTLVVRVACELSIDPLRKLWAVWLWCTLGKSVLANGPLYDVIVFLFLLLSFNEEDASESEKTKSLSYWLEEDVESDARNLRGAEQGRDENVKIWADCFTEDASPSCLLEISADLDLFTCDWLGADTRDNEVEDGLWGGTWVFFHLISSL